MQFQKLAYSLCTMFAIVEKMISLASFDIRLAHAGTSVVSSYLIFRNFKFCLCKFKGLITLKKMQVFWKILHHFHLWNLYIPWLITPKLLFVFSTKIYFQFSTLQLVGDLGPTSEMGCDSSEQIETVGYCCK